MALLTTPSWTLSLTLFVLAFGTNLRAQADSPDRDTSQCDTSQCDTFETHVRGGIPNLLQKIKAGGGKELRVAYLGGSITAAPGWRIKSLEWLQSRYPEVKWSEIYAAIGGTGSDLGVYRVQQDALRHKPDLLFVEFAVNDGSADPVKIQKSMEGIVRQAWTSNPEMDILFVYTLSEPYLAELQAGKCSRSVTAMEEVADHYGIPSIHLGIEVAKREKEGTLIFHGDAPAKGTEPAPGSPMLFSTDGVHPLPETGHVLYVEAIARSWAEFEKSPPATDKKHTLSEPLRADHWAAAKLIPITAKMLKGDWMEVDPAAKGEELGKKFERFFPTMWRTATPGASLTFQFRGTEVGFFDVVGPDGGQLQVSIDGGEPKIVPRFDAYCVYPRLSKFQVGTDLDPESLHTVTINLDAASPDKREKLFEKNRPDFDRHPERYAENRWNVGYIMLLGEPAGE
ncbi:MAG TPA: GDSL-type esterase/lipase family protein [Verrucomicrobiales bacterium]|nr:GDSL-type esterase/lipase family protein [Verrucomicrobiales bacterium]